MWSHARAGAELQVGALGRSVRTRRKELQKHGTRDARERGRGRRELVDRGEEPEEVGYLFEDDASLQRFERYAEGGFGGGTDGRGSEMLARQLLEYGERNGSIQVRMQLSFGQATDESELGWRECGERSGCGPSDLGRHRW